MARRLGFTVVLHVADFPSDDGPLSDRSLASSTAAACGIYGESLAHLRRGGEVGIAGLRASNRHCLCRGGGGRGAADLDPGRMRVRDRQPGRRGGAERKCRANGLVGDRRERDGLRGRSYRKAVKHGGGGCIGGIAVLVGPNVNRSRSGDRDRVTRNRHRTGVSVGDRQAGRGRGPGRKRRAPVSLVANRREGNRLRSSGGADRKLELIRANVDAPVDHTRISIDIGFAGRRHERRIARIDGG